MATQAALRRLLVRRVAPPPHHHRAHRVQTVEHLQPQLRSLVAQGAGVTRRTLQDAQCPAIGESLHPQYGDGFRFCRWGYLVPRVAMRQQSRFPNTPEAKRICKSGLNGREARREKRLLRRMENPDGAHINPDVKQNTVHKRGVAFKRCSCFFVSFRYS